MPNPVPAPLPSGADLAQLRRQAGISQRELAELAGMDRASINRLEHKPGAMPRSTGFHLALVFAWIARAAAPSRDAVVVHAKPPGRRGAIHPSQLITYYRLEDGREIGYADALALPVGAFVWCLSAIGREPSESLGDQWSKAVRTDHPSQPLRQVNQNPLV